eukprot:gnl/TRDRNA2_/TRDRNA2_193397_c0_seq1.p1 gnl/TRDRNA2_/TRDRNA2_193397_c0~~gnl/TRDRNA2_/TRDRNA2_193397_c0_seq1.p1  ORF type:complete len:152 (-),score=20.57 gnl/TRDRNA2_/TRDRNA2_193397_c0_seq1:218-673(-)
MFASDCTVNPTSVQRPPHGGYPGDFRQGLPVHWFSQMDSPYSPSMDSENMDDVLMTDEDMSLGIPFVTAGDCLSRFEGLTAKRLGLDEFELPLSKRVCLGFYTAEPAACSIENKTSNKRRRFSEQGSLKVAFPQGCATVAVSTGADWGHRR